MYAYEFNQVNKALDKVEEQLDKSERALRRFWIVFGTVVVINVLVVGTINKARG